VFVWIKVAAEGAGATDYVVKAGGYLGPLALASAATALVIVETWEVIDALARLLGRYLMVLGAYLRRRFNLNDKKDERPVEQEPVQYDHSANRPPEAFYSSTPPGQVEVEDTENRHEPDMD
jgi:hypothetical protein